MLTPSSTRALLESLGHRPVRKLGQNFLVDPNLVRKSLALAEVRAGDAVVEIGPGLGTLTGALLDAGATVFAVEYDPRLASHVRSRLAAAIESGRFHLLEGDAVDHPRAGLPPDGDFLAVANLPYAITTPWLDGLLAGPLPRRLVLMLQKEAADRLVASPGSKTFGAISIFLQGAYVVGGRHQVSRGCFYPAPEVDSLLLRLDRRDRPVRYHPELREAIRHVFTQRRKQMAALARATPLLGPWFEDLMRQGLPPTIRAEEIPLAAWEALARAPGEEGS